MAQKFFFIPLENVPVGTKPLGYEVWYPSWSKECPNDIPENMRDKLGLFAVGSTMGELPQSVAAHSATLGEAVRVLSSAAAHVSVVVAGKDEKDPPPPPSLLLLKHNCLAEYLKALQEWKAFTQDAEEMEEKK